MILKSSHVREPRLVQLVKLLVQLGVHWLLAGVQTVPASLGLNRRLGCILLRAPSKALVPQMAHKSWQGLDGWTH
jgi:hypothetical protein